MRTRIAVVAAWGLALLMGVPASAQSGNQAGESKGRQADSQKSKDLGQSQSKDSGQSQGQTETVRGEIAGVSVVGETMVDYSSGRGVVAEFTYLTILGSNRNDTHSAAGNKAASGDDTGKGSHDQASSGSQKDQGSNKDRGNRGGSGGASDGHRRRVYQVAVGPETRVRYRGNRGGQGSDDQKGEQKESARQQSQSSLERLQLGDRVEVEFTRMTAQGGRPGGGAGDDQKGSSNQARHGRDRIVRGMARTITILSEPEHGGGDSSSSGNKSGSGSGDKKSDEKK